MIRRAVRYPQETLNKRIEHPRYREAICCHVSSRPSRFVEAVAQVVESKILSVSSSIRLFAHAYRYDQAEHAKLLSCPHQEAGEFSRWVLDGHAKEFVSNMFFMRAGNDRLTKPSLVDPGRFLSSKISRNIGYV